ncbi:undecaprenyl-diphosphate phosphatase [Candidatus Fermentibacteria bacterium]|nr:undecaprenyl-diphosphate phosphatase [Candidatus Fermentibacteria bacterium]
MKPIPVAILAAVQGLTEFLPVSSSGHLVIGGALLDAGDGGGLLLEVTLHLGTLCAVLFFYRSDIAALVRGCLAGERSQLALLALLALASVPAGLLGVLAREDLEGFFGSPGTAALLLVLNGLMLVSSRAIPRGACGRPGPVGALLAGMAQAVAILPGISRSGSTIVALTVSGVSRVDAARFSFLMSIPAIAGAGALQAARIQSVPAADLPVLAAGFAISALSGLAALRLLVVMLRGGRFWLFGVYCILAGVVSALLLKWGVTA